MDSLIFLSSEERKQLFTEASVRHGRMPATVLEKDFWVCWTLQQLFKIQEIAPYLIFKGGTSLSKAYGLIERFSEDIDLTIDKEYLGISEKDWPKDITSRKARQEFRKKLDKISGEATRIKILPLLEERFAKIFNAKSSNGWSLTIAPNDPLTILFNYPVSVSYGNNLFRGNFGTGNFADSYIKPVIRLELGARGDIFPVASRSLSSYMAEIIPEIFESSDDLKITVPTLEAERTFLEKITILHDICHKEEDKPLKKASARHYYDVFMLIQKGIAKEALKDRALFEAVVNNARLNCTDSNESQAYKAYDELLNLNGKLIPSENKHLSLQRDYKEMQESGMFFADFPSFEEIIKELKNLEHTINLK